MKTSAITLLLSLFVWANSEAQYFNWAKTTGGYDDDYGLGVAIDKAGNVYITGSFKGTVDFDPGSGTYTLTSSGFWDIFVLKLDASGNFIWAKQMGGSGWDEAFSIAVDDAGNVYTTGYFEGTADFDPSFSTYYFLPSSGPMDIFVSKLDSAGNFIWAKKFGSDQIDLANSITTDKNGNIYVTGYYKGTAYFGGDSLYVDSLTAVGEKDVFVLKLNQSGNYIWAKSLGGSYDDFGYSVSVDNAGNVYTTGFFKSTADFDPGSAAFNLTSAGDYDVFISKLDPSGNFVWAKSVGSSGIDVGTAIDVDMSGNVYTAGYFANVADFDPGSATFNISSAGSYDIFVLKLNQSGSFVWAKGMGSVNSDKAYSLSVDDYGNIYTTGYFKSVANFGQNISLTSAGDKDVFVQKSDSAGNVVWVKGIGGTSDDFGGCVVADITGNVFITGSFQGSADFDPGSSTFNSTSVGAYDLFVEKLNQFSIGYDNSNASSQTIKTEIYPNPNNGDFILSINTGVNSPRIFQMELYNAIGALMYSEKLEISNSLRKQVHLENLKKGMYFIRLKNKDAVAVKAFIVK